MADVTLTAADGHELSAFRAGAEDAGRALVVVQEIFGVNGHMRRTSERLAAAGYLVLCPALFDRAERGVQLGYEAADRERGMALRARVPEAGAVADVEAAAAALSGGGRPVGIIGYCWGGTLAWWGATRTGRFGAAVGWYGGGVAGTRGERPACPVQLHFGEEDGGIPMTDVALIREAQPAVEVFSYPGAGHGFGCDDRASFDRAARDLAEERSLRFLGAALGAAPR